MLAYSLSAYGMARNSRLRFPVHTDMQARAPQYRQMRAAKDRPALCFPNTLAHRQLHCGYVGFALACRRAHSAEPRITSADSANNPPVIKPGS